MFRFSRLFFKPDKNLKNNKGSKRKIGISGNSYKVTIPPYIIEQIFQEYKTEYLELFVDEHKGKKFLSLYPCEENSN